MINVIICILIIILVMICILQEFIVFHNMKLILGVNRKKYMFLVLDCVFQIIWIIGTIILDFSILLFLTGLYVSFLIAMFPLHKANSACLRFFQMKFVVLTAVILILLGSACLFGTDVRQVSHIREVRLFVLLAAKTAELIYIVLHEKKFSLEFERLERDHKKIGLFQGFLRCCLVYIYADGVLAMFDFGGDFVPALMISGNLLILILMFLFYRFDYAMEEKEYLEKEHQELIEEKAREAWKAEQLKSMSERDALTNAYSRRYVIQSTARFKENKIPFLIVYIDMDGMKEINDTRGHLEGDIYLKNFVGRISDRLQGEDFISRVGGDEFLIVLCRCSAEDAKKQMEEIRRLLLPEYSFSYGISSAENDVEVMIEEADRSMYNYKKRKKNERGSVK